MRVWRICAVMIAASVTALGTMPASAGARTHSTGKTAHFVGPTGLAVDAAGDVYVGDGVAGRAATRVQKISPSGRVLVSWTFPWRGGSQNGAIVSLAIGPRGRVWAGNTIGHQILEYTANGRLLRRFGHQGTRPGTFQELSGIAANAAGDVYVTDMLNNNVQKFSATGRLLAVWPASGALKAGRYAGPFFGPRGIAVGPGGSIYVVDGAGLAGRIVELSPAGKVLAQWKQSGKGPGQFNSPFDLAVGRDGTVYVSDTDNYRIQKLTAHGQPLAVWRPHVLGFFEPVAIGIAPSGRVYVIDLSSQGVMVFSPRGKLVARWM